MTDLVKLKGNLIKRIESLFKGGKENILKEVMNKITDNNFFDGFVYLQQNALDVFLDFIESLRDFRGQCSLKTFLFTIARNKVIDIIRKKKIKKILFSALSPHVVEGLKTIFLDEEIEKKELAAKIKKVFKKLPNDYQLVLRLKYVEGEKVKSIAHKLSLGFKAT
ncbi:MAG: RNA polymerase sigma factor, partial [Fervidobacterium sp.]